MKNHTKSQNAFRNKKYCRVPSTKCFWHLTSKDVNLTLQPEKLHTGLLKDGISVVTNVNLNKLFSRMTEADREMFHKRKLYNISFERRKTDDVLRCWEKNIRLIPPTIVVYDSEYHRKLGMHGNKNDWNRYASSELMPIEGKHRLNAAYCIGQKRIPILVLKNQRAKIKRKLGIT